jgi:site-specific recombinase XerD
MKKNAPKTPEQILQSYRQCLEQTLGFASSTCRNHLRDIAHFLEAVPIRRPQELADLTPVELTSYLSGRSVDYQPGSLRQIAGSLRQFLRFVQQQGWTEDSLSSAVPQIACRTRTDLPTYLTEEQLSTLLASFDPSTVDGRRDLAITLCLARLGLRAGEVAAL